MSSSIKHTYRPTGPLAPQYINGVYIPATLLIATTALLKLEWTPFAIAIAAALAGYQVYAHRKAAHVSS